MGGSAATPSALPCEKPIPTRCGKWSNFRAAVEHGRAATGEKDSCVLRASFQHYGQWSTSNFEALRVIGTGAYGVVNLVRRKGTSELYALKHMEKARYEQKNQNYRAFVERDALAEARSRWIVQLFATFQDDRRVYMLMEFVQGGDLLGHLQRWGQFSDAEAAFYMAELLEALDMVHRSGFVHRDVKPENIVISPSGHIKLLDFGLCQNSQHPKDSSDVVGTPQYMSPESFGGSYGPGSDLWAMGVITFECLAGWRLFQTRGLEGREAVRMIRSQVHQHVDVVRAALERCRLGEAAKRLVLGLVCERESRSSAALLRGEPFFAGVDFAQIHLSRPPFVPKLKSMEDTSLFDDFGRVACLPLPGPRIAWDRGLDWAHFDADVRALASDERGGIALLEAARVPKRPVAAGECEGLASLEAARVPEDARPVCGKIHVIPAESLDSAGSQGDVGDDGESDGGTEATTSGSASKQQGTARGDSSSSSWVQSL